MQTPRCPARRRHEGCLLVVLFAECVCVCAYNTATVHSAADGTLQREVWSSSCVRWALVALARSPATTATTTGTCSWMEGSSSTGRLIIRSETRL